MESPGAIEGRGRGAQRLWIRTAADRQVGDHRGQCQQRRHAGGATLCIVTHDPRWLARAQRRLYLLDGRLADRPADA